MDCIHIYISSLKNHSKRFRVQLFKDTTEYWQGGGVRDRSTNWLVDNPLYLPSHNRTETRGLVWVPGISVQNFIALASSCRVDISFYRRQKHSVFLVSSSNAASVGSRFRFIEQLWSSVLNTRRSRYHAVAHITWPIFSEKRSNQQHSRGVPEMEHTRSPRGQTAITEKEIQSSTSLEAKCKV